MNSQAEQNQNIVFFDGVCHLCNGFVDAVISRDSKRNLRFAPLQGQTAEKLLSLEDRTHLETVIYFEKGKVHRRSQAVLRILTSLGGAYRLFALLQIIPTPLCDFIYKFIAKNRYAWFGEREFCRLPSPEERGYLLP